MGFSPAAGFFAGGGWGPQGKPPTAVSAACGRRPRRSRGALRAVASAPPPPAERGGFARWVLPLLRFTERGRLAFSPFAGRQGAPDGREAAAPCAGRQGAPDGREAAAPCAGRQGTPGTAPQGPRRSRGKGAGAARPLRRPEAGALRGPLPCKRVAARNATPPHEFN